MFGRPYVECDLSLPVPGGRGNAGPAGGEGVIVDCQCVVSAVRLLWPVPTEPKASVAIGVQAQGSDGVMVAIGDITGSTRAKTVRRRISFRVSSTATHSSSGEGFRRLRGVRVPPRLLN